MSLASELIVNVINGLYFGSILYLIAVGITLEYGVLNLANIAHAVFFVVAGYLMVALMEAIGPQLAIGSNIVPFVVLTLTTLALMIVIGIAIERALFSRFLYELTADYQLLATFGFMLLALDVVVFIWGNTPVGLSGDFNLATVLGQVQLLGATYPVYNLVVIVLTAVVVVGLYLLYERTNLGKVSHAVAQDKEMAEIIGVNVNLIQVISGAVAIGTASLAGILLVGNSTIHPPFAVDFVILGFVVVVIGGMGSLRGAIIGSLVLGLVRSFGIRYVPNIELAIAFLLMALIILVRPKGLIRSEGIK